MPFSKRFGERRVATADLRATDIPDVGDTWVRLKDGEMFGPDDDWSLHNFALSFDSSTFFADVPHEYASFTDSVEQIYERQPEILRLFTTTGLRSLLFQEQRKMKDSYPGRVTPYVADIVATIKKRLLK